MIKQVVPPRAVELVASKLHIHKLEDWYNVYHSHLKLFKREFPELKEYPFSFSFSF